MKKALTTIVAVAGVSAGLTAAAMPAHASPSRCQPDYLCLWEGNGSGGTFGAWNRSAPNLGRFGTRVGSVANRSPVAWTLNRGTNGATPTLCVKAGAASSSVSGFTDATRSITRLSSNTCPGGLRVIG